MTAPLSLMGLDIACPSCMQPGGSRCRTGGGAIRKQTCDARMRAALYAPGTPRAWFTEQMTRVTA